MGYGNIQDADEFYSFILNALSATLTTQHGTVQSNLIKDLFEIRYRCTYSCPESGESYTTEEITNKLYCNIRGGANTTEKVNFMFQVGEWWMVMNGYEWLWMIMNDYEWLWMVMNEEWWNHM